MPDYLPTDPADAPTANQEAIRNRARDTLDNDAGQPTASRQRKLLTALAVTLVVAALILVIDFGVRVMHFILTVWYGDPNEQAQPAPPSVNPYDPTKPFYITVNPPVDNNSKQQSSTSSQAPK